MRADVGIDDVVALLAGVSRARRHTTDERPLTVILDGLRAPGGP